MDRYVPKSKIPIEKLNYWLGKAKRKKKKVILINGTIEEKVNEEDRIHYSVLC